MAKAKLPTVSNKDKHELAFFRLWKMMYPNLPQPVRDYKFHPVRRWKIDWAWPDYRIGVELHGGGKRSRHATVKGMAADCEKNNAGLMLGWRVLAYNVVAMKNMHNVVDEVASLVRREWEPKVITRKGGAA